MVHAFNPSRLEAKAQGVLFQFAERDPVSNRLALGRQALSPACNPQALEVELSSL